MVSIRGVDLGNCGRFGVKCHPGGHRQTGRKLRLLLGQGAPCQHWAKAGETNWEFERSYSRMNGRHHERTRMDVWEMPPTLIVIVDAKAAHG